MVDYAGERGAKLIVENRVMEGWHPDGYPGNDYLGNDYLGETITWEK
jgi:hypothetical protein